MPQPRPPFRAEHVGSLLRPDALKDARAKAQAGETSAAELAAIEDEAIRRAVRLQEDAGLPVVTDGELRRSAWHTDFLTALDGVKATRTSYAVSFHDDEGHEEQIATMMAVTGKVRRSRPIMGSSFAFLKSASHATPKLSIPSPTYLHLRGGRRSIPASVYPDIEAFWTDVVDAYAAELADLSAAGCRYVQLDDVSIAFLCDEAIRAQVAKDGERPEALAGQYAKVISAISARRPPEMTIAVHTCRGNHHSLWMAEGGYDPIAEAVFAELDVDGLFLEFDTERSGGFEPLRFVPKGKRVVLGLISSKSPALEDPDELERRIDEASRFIPIEDLAISPQCGFASTAVGNQLTEDDERRKLELVVEVAEAVWGSVDG
jgi:5-methyltetrahydropteroyltriglutamate--homocysteine methyltransferase